jgi:hypothetical protein
MLRRSFALGLIFAATAAFPAFSQEIPPEAIAEGLPEHLIYSLQISVPTVVAGQQLSTSSKIWQRDDVLKVCFFGGNPVVKQLIASVAIEWNNYSPVHFDFGTPGEWRDCMNPKSGFNQIRVGFGDRGYWSLIGRDGDDLTLNSQPTMNFYRFDFRYNPRQVNQSGQYLTAANVSTSALPYDRGTILHEFGHALGLLHEHQNPNLKCQDDIRWSEAPTVYDYFSQPPNEWTPDMVNFNIGAISLSEPDWVAGAPDPSSIMMYELPNQIKKQGAKQDCFGHRNSELSALDKQWIAKIYSAQGAGVQVDHSSGIQPTSAVVAASSPSVKADLLTRVSVDLLSDVTSVRREARRQLAGLLQASQSPALASQLVEEAVGKSYRHQLGVAEALGATTLPFKADKTAKAKTLLSLSQMITKNKDSTLAKALADAKQVVK